MLYEDNPISKGEEDILNRWSFVKRIWDVLINWKWKESMVLAMWWKWWTWKTSIIRLLEDNIKDNGDFFVFDPRLYNQDTDIQKKFFDELWSHLWTEGNTYNDSTLIENLETYSELLWQHTSNNFTNIITTKDFFWLWTIILWIIANRFPTIIDFNLIKSYISITFIVFGFVVLFRDKILFAIAWFKKTKSLKLKAKKRSIKEIKIEIENSLSKKDKKIIIVIDDIERLTPQQAKTVFQIVKTNANFPNTVFFLVFDKNILLEVVKNENISREYLHKIIQVYFDIPEISQNKILQYLFSCLDYILKEELPDNYDFDSEYWSNIFHRWIKDNFQTLRDVKRFCNSLKFNINLVVNKWYIEVNPIDFIALECLRNFHPLLFDFIKNNKSLLLESGRESNWYKAKSNKDIIIEKIKEINYSESYDLLEQLFPQISWTYDVGHRASEWIKKQRICSDKYFDVFFSYVPGGDEWKINDYDIQTCIINMDSVENSEKYIETIGKDKDIRDFFWRILSYVDDPEKINENQIINFLIAISNRFQEYPQWRNWMRDFGIDTDVWRLFYRWLKRFYVEKDKFLEILKKIIVDSQCIYPVMSFTRTHLLNKKEWKTNPDWLILEENEEEELKKILLEKLEKYFFDKKELLLDNDSELLYELIVRKELWSDEEKMKKFILELIGENENNFIKFIKLFIGIWYSQTMGSYHQKTNKNLNTKWLLGYLSNEYLNIMFEKVKWDDVVYQKNKEDIDFIQQEITIYNQKIDNEKANN